MTTAERDVIIKEKNFHAEYANNKAVVLIEEGIISEGYLPKRQLKLVLAWAEIHKDELMQKR